MQTREIPLEATIVLSSKGQIVIPKEMRTSANLHDGEKMLIRVRKDNVIELVPMKKNVDELFSIFPKAYEKNRIDDDTLIRSLFSKGQKKK